MELYRTVNCLDYVGSDPPIPALRVQLAEPIHGYTMDITAPIDTGFAGYLLLDRETYDKLGTAELPRELFGAYKTMAGPVVLRRARVLIQLADRKFESYVETPLFGEGKILLGRRTISSVNIAFLGKESRCCQLLLEGL